MRPLVAVVACMACGAAMAFAPHSSPPLAPPAASSTALWAKKGSSKKGAGGGGSSKISLRGFGGTLSKPSKTGNDSAPATEGVLLRDPASTALYSWLAKAGVDMRKVALAEFGGTGRGVMALEDIPRGACIMEVPAKWAIDLGDEGANPTPHALELLKVWANDDGKWGPYMASLPQPGGGDLTTTDFMSEEELAMLQWPPVVEETRRRLQLCERMYNNVIKMQVELGVAFGGKNVTLEDLKWAVFIVVSRVLTVVRTDMAYAKLLIPGIDMFNHDAASPHVLTGRAAAGANLRVLAGEDVPAGSQVFIAYSGGTPRSDRFIQDYGFVDSEGCAAQDKELMSGSTATRYAADLAATTIEEDAALLAGGTLNRRAAAAVAFRLALKRAAAA